MSNESQEPGIIVEERQKTLQALPPENLWTPVKVMQRREDGALAEVEVRVPFEQEEVDAIEKARKVADGLGEHGERGSDGVIRDFWIAVLGAGFFEDFLPNEALQNRPTAISTITHAREVATGCIHRYQDEISRIRNEEHITEPEYMWTRMKDLYEFHDLLGMMKLHDVIEEGTSEEK